MECTCDSNRFLRNETIYIYILQRFKFSAIAIPQTVLLCPEKNVFHNLLLNFCGSHRLNLQVRIFIVKTHWLDVVATPLNQEY